MANVDGIDTTVTGGLAARSNGRVSVGSVGRDGPSGVAQGRAPVQGDRVELSGSAREAASESLVRDELVSRVRSEIENDPDDYINRTLNQHIDVIIDRIAQDL